MTRTQSRDIVWARPPLPVVDTYFKGAGKGAYAVAYTLVTAAVVHA